MALTGAGGRDPATASSGLQHDTLMVESIADQLYRIMRDRIVTGQYAPGSRLDPQSIASEFGVSRTPVRDALAQLETDRLIETKPRAGTFIVQPTLRDIHEVCQVRKGIEWVATGIATERMPADLLHELREEIVEAERQAEAGNYQPFFDSDARLHQEIVRATGNTRLIRARATVEPFVVWLRVLGATGSHRINGSTHRHLEIVDAMIRGDVAAAQAAAALHLDEVEEWTAADMESALQP